MCGSFHENVEETIYKLCSSLKWFAKGILLLVLFMGAYESENDSFLHSECLAPTVTTDCLMSLILLTDFRRLQ